MQSIIQEKFNNSIVTALLFNALPLTEKEKKLQLFLAEHEERYDIFCDNIHRLYVDKNKDLETNTLYLTIEGFSFLSDSAIEHQLTCFPVLTLNKYSPNSPDISIYIETALIHFSSYCEFAKNIIRSLHHIA